MSSEAFNKIKQGLEEAIAFVKGEPSEAKVTQVDLKSLCPPAIDGCTCTCHSVPGTTHILPCCGYIN